MLDNQFMIQRNYDRLLFGIDEVSLKQSIKYVNGPCSKRYWLLLCIGNQHPWQSCINMDDVDNLSASAVNVSLIYFISDWFLEGLLSTAVFSRASMELTLVDRFWFMMPVRSWPELMLGRYLSGTVVERLSLWFHLLFLHDMHFSLLLHVQLAFESVRSCSIIRL